MIDPIADTDLMAFVDGQLDGMRRLDVEAHLARHPEAAARVMAEMRDRDALRQAFAAPGRGPERNRAAARRLDRAMGWSRIAARLKRAAAIAVLVGAGWLAHDEIGRFGVPDTFAAPVDPALVTEAQQARRVARLRARIASQRGSPAYDRGEIEAATGIGLPGLPEGWRVRDVQVFPARNGAGVEVAFETADRGEVSLFATRRGEGGPDTPVTEAGDGATLAWNAGISAYAVSGARDAADLRRAALALAAAR